MEASNTRAILVEVVHGQTRPIAECTTTTLSIKLELKTSPQSPLISHDLRAGRRGNLTRPSQGPATEGQTRRASHPLIWRMFWMAGGLAENRIVRTKAAATHSIHSISAIFPMSNYHTWQKYTKLREQTCYSCSVYPAQWPAVLTVQAVADSQDLTYFLRQ